MMETKKSLTQTKERIPALMPNAARFPDNQAPKWAPKTEYDKEDIRDFADNYKLDEYARRALVESLYCRHHLNPFDELIKDCTVTRALVELDTAEVIYACDLHIAGSQNPSARLMMLLPEILKGEKKT